MKFEWFVSWRYLKRRKGNFFLSAVTLIAVLGVAVGVGTVVVVLAVMNGFDRELEEKITGNLPPVIVEREGGIKNYNQVISELQKMSRVTSASPFIQRQGLLQYGGRISGFSVMGIDVNRQDTVNGISRILKYGSFDLGQKVRLEGKKRVETSGIIIGRELARRLGVTVGARVKCISASFSKKSGTLVPSLVEYEVTGVFVSGMYEIDSTLAYVSLESGRKLCKIGDSVDGIEVKLDDIYKARELSREIELKLGPAFSASSWMERHRNLFSALRLEKTTMFVILALIILVAAFNIASTLIMMVMKKTKDIGILKAIGVSNFRVMCIFILEGMLIGLFGVLLGVTGGFILCTLLAKYPMIQLPSEIYLLDRLPVVMSAGDFISIGAVAFFLSFLATLYPSWKAACINPVEALRYE